MFSPDLKIWINGQITTLEKSGVSPLTHSLHYGSGAFEGIRAYKDTSGKTNVFRLQEHIDRLFYSSEVVFLKIPYSKEEIVTACVDVVKANNLEEAYIRPLAFHDGSTLGISVAKNKPQVLVAAWSWGQYLSDSVTVEVSPYRRISEKSTICDAKISGHYVNSLLASTHAKTNGYQEALLLDHNDCIAEGPGENIFFVKDKEIHTPKLGKILKGITRDAVITFAEDLGYKIIERDIVLKELADFESAFFTGTAAEISPILNIDQDGKTLRTFDLKKSNELKMYFLDIVHGNNKKYQQWLHSTSK